MRWKLWPICSASTFTDIDMRKKLFESPFMDALSNAIDVVWAGMLWIVCSLPIITVGAASQALYYCIAKCVRRQRGTLTASFFKAFCSNFKHATLIWLIYLAYVIIGIIDLRLVLEVFPGSSLLTALTVTAFFPVLITLPWIFAYVSRFENRTMDSIKYTFFISIRNIGRTLVLVILLAAWFFVAWLIPLSFVFLPGVICLLMSFFIEPSFRAITTKIASDENADQWYNE